jgi:predicted glycoside hydrolase/deacetylase ChbG (UPF0249 family)
MVSAAETAGRPSKSESSSGLAVLSVGEWLRLVQASAGCETVHSVLCSVIVMQRIGDSQRYIVNADDFGKSPSVNSAIGQCFSQQLISSASIMANMPGFDDACQIGREWASIGRIGIHIVLSEGKPLTDAIKSEARFCDQDGLFRPRQKSKRFLYLSTSERNAVGAEVQAQIEKCRRELLPLTHLDSHHHFHEEWGIMGVILPLIRQYQIPCVRIMRNASASCKIQRKLYGAVFNAMLRWRGLARTTLFGSVDDFCEYSKQRRAKIRPRAFEIMVHPTLDEEGEVVDGRSHAPLSDLLEKLGAVRS